MRNFIAIFILSFLCFGAGEAVAAVSGEEAQLVKNRLTPQNSSVCAWEAARHAYSTLIARYTDDVVTQRLVRSSYAVNVLEYGCLGTPEGEWELRGSNKTTNRQLLQTMATVSYPALFEWEPGALTLSPSEPWLSFSLGYEPHAPSTVDEITYMQRLKAESDVQAAITTYKHVIKDCVIS